MALKTDQIQLSLFSRDIIVNKKAKLVGELDEKFSSVFNGDPFILPIRDDAPAEIPRVVLKSKDEGRILQISLNRLDLFFNYRPGSELQFPNKSIQDIFIEIFKLFKTNFGINFDRIGFISQWLVDVDGNKVSKFMAEKYIKDNFDLSKVYNLNINLEFRDKIEDFEINKIVQVSPAINTFHKDKVFLLFVTDINTIKEKEITITEDSINKFIKISSDETLALQKIYIG